MVAAMSIQQEDSHQSSGEKQLGNNLDESCYSDNFEATGVSTKQKANLKSGANGTQKPPSVPNRKINPAKLSA